MTLTTMRQERGKDGENLIMQLLKSQGYTILARNFRLRGGEIDIIAQRDEAVVCVEVKLRTKSTIDLAELILPSKQRKITEVAKAFVSRYSMDEYTVQFDVALVTYISNKYTIDYIANAFESFD